MRKLLVIAVSALLALGAVTSAQGEVIEYSGTLVVDFGNLGPVPVRGMGVVTVNNSSGGDHIQTLKVHDGFNGAKNTVPVTDPEITGTIPSVIVTGTLGGTGTTLFSVVSISGGGPVDEAQRTIPLRGLARICLGAGGCDTPGALNLVLTTHTTGSNVIGVGIGGLLTIGGGGDIRLSLENSPWTIGTRTLNTQTANGGFRTLMGHGWAHGPASQTSSTAANSGVLQLISPVQIHALGLPGNSVKIGIFNVLRLHFVPEPGMLLLLGSGVVGMALLGRRRLKK